MINKKYCKKRRKLALLFFIAALICLCFLSTKLMLVILAVSLIVLGILLLKC